MDVVQSNHHIHHIPYSFPALYHETVQIPAIDMAIICHAASMVICTNISEIYPPSPVQPQFGEGLTIQSVIIILEKPNEKVIADSLETEAFFRAFQLRPGSVSGEFCRLCHKKNQ